MCCFYLCAAINVTVPVVKQTATGYTNPLALISIGKMAAEMEGEMEDRAILSSIKTKIKAINAIIVNV